MRYLLSIVLAAALPVGVLAQCGEPDPGPRWSRDGDLLTWGEVVETAAAGTFLVGGGDALRTLSVDGGGALSIDRATTTNGIQPFLVFDPRSDLVYASDDAAGITVFDAGDPNAPVALGSVELPAAAARLAVAGDLLLAACDGGLAVLGLGSSVPGLPTAPELLSFAEVAGAEGVSVAGVAGATPVAWFGTMEHGVRAWDLDDPNQPVAAGFPIGANALNAVYDMVAVDGRLVATGQMPDASYRVLVYTITDPLTPTLQGTAVLEPPLVGETVPGLDLLVPGVDQQGWIVTLGGLWGLTVSSTGDPSLSLYPSGQPAWAGALTGNRILTSGPSGLDAYTTSGTLNPYTHTDEITASGLHPYRVGLAGGLVLAWLASPDPLIAELGELAVLEMGSDTGLTEITSAAVAVPLVGDVDVAAAARHAWVRDADGLTVVDLTAPRTPAVTKVAAPSLVSGRRPAAAGPGLLLVGVENSEPPPATPQLEIWALADPAVPGLAGTLDLPAAAAAVELLPEARGACALADGRVLLLDLSDPNNPSSDGELELPPGAGALDLAHSGRELVVLLDDGAVMIVGATGGSRFSLLSAGSARISVSGDLVLAPQGSGGLTGLAIDGGGTTEAGWWETAGVATDVVAHAVGLVVADGDGFVTLGPRPCLALAGETDGDGSLGPADLTALAAEILDGDGFWTDEVGAAGPHTSRAADVDGSDAVDAADAAVLIELLAALPAR